MPTTIEALLIIVLVLSPGYAFTQIARRVIAYVEEPTDARFFLTIIAAGTGIHVLVFPWTVRIVQFYLAKVLLNHRWEVFTWAVVTIFVVPLALGILIGRLSVVGWIDGLLDKIGLGYLDRMPSAWDYVVRQQHGKYVRVHLKDGKGVIGGLYSTQSLGSNNSRRADLYLEECWRLDASGNFELPFFGSSGVWIAHDIMGYVEFFEGEDEPYEGYAAGEEDGRTTAEDVGVVE